MDEKQKNEKRRRADNAAIRFCPVCGTGKLFPFQAAQRCEDCGRAFWIVHTSSADWTPTPKVKDSQ